MKRTLFFLCMSLPALTLRAQKAATGCAFTDAVNVKQAMNLQNYQEVKNILSYYFPDSSQSLLAQLTDTLRGQAMLRDFLNSDPGNKSAAPVAVIQGGESIAVPGASDAINALGTFIADRFKQEINIAFLTKFRDDLEKQPLIGGLLPLSNMVMQQSDPYNYTSFMETLQEAFDSDLRNLPVNLSKAIQSGGIPFKNQETKFITCIGLDMGGNILQNPTDPLTALTKLYKNPYLDSVKPDVRNGLLAVNFTVNAMRVKNPNQIFMSAADMKLLQRNDSLFHIYAALLIKQNERIFKLTNTGQLVNSLMNLTVMTEQLNQKYTELKSLYGTDKLKPEQVIAWYKYFLASTRSLFMFAKTDLGQKYNPEVDVVFNKLDTLGIIAGYVNGEKYGLACLFSVQLLQSTLTGIPAQLGQYLTFAANMLQAETSDDMVAVLENSAMPVGSYRVKRNSTFDVSLNAYAGGFFGYNQKNDDGLYGFTAPVGLYFGWGNLWDDLRDSVKNNDRGKALGFFIPMVDVGAVTAFRLASGTSQMAEISWANVFAPGAYVTFGAGRCPVSFNLGGQYGPQLRSIDATGKPVLFVKEWYWRAAVLIDIPVFDFYTKQYAHKTTRH